jgi:acetylornithine deacetylase
MSFAMETLDRLVAFDTVSRNPCRATIDWVAGLLRSWGAAVEVLPGPESGKANLLARIGPPRHIDVVPSTARAGRAIPSGWRSGRAVSTAEAPPT